MKPLRLVMCGCVLIVLGGAIVRLFEALEPVAAPKLQPEREPVARVTVPLVATPLDLTLRWLKDGAKGDPAPFWDQLIYIAENREGSSELRMRAINVLQRHSMPQLHALILKATGEVEGYDAELRQVDAVYTRKRRDLDRDIQELKLRYPLADSPQDTNRYGAEEMKELVSYALSYKRDRMVLDGALARLAEVRQADYERIQQEQDVFRSQVSQLQVILEHPGYLPLADVAAWSPTLLPIEKRLHTRISFSAINMRLEDLSTHFTQLSGVPINLDPQAANAKNMRVSLRVSEMDASLAMQWVARLVELEALEADGAILLTTRDPKRGEKNRAANAVRAKAGNRLEQPHVPSEAPGDF